MKAPETCKPRLQSSRDQRSRALLHSLTGALVISLLVLALPLPAATAGPKASGNGCHSLLRFDYGAERALARFSVDLGCNSRKANGDIHLNGYVERCEAPGTDCDRIERGTVCKASTCKLRIAMTHADNDAGFYRTRFTYQGDGKGNPSGYSEAELICYSLPQSQTGCEG